MGWSIPIEKLVEVTKDDLNTAVRKVTLELFSMVIESSPVGNPEMWAENSKVMDARKAYADQAMAFNAANPGKRRKGTSAATIAKKFPLAGGKGYVGGRFKNNWLVSYGTPAAGTPNEPNGGGAASMAEASKSLTLPTGGQVYLVNNLPYAQRLEYGWSKQAPTGMVRNAVRTISMNIDRIIKERT